MPQQNALWVCEVCVIQTHKRTNDVSDKLRDILFWHMLDGAVGEAWILTSSTIVNITQGPMLLEDSEKE